jgi:hypothetical protein
VVVVLLVLVLELDELPPPPHEASTASAGIRSNVLRERRMLILGPVMSVAPQLQRRHKNRLRTLHEAKAAGAEVSISKWQRSRHDQAM